MPPAADGSRNAGARSPGRRSAGRPTLGHPGSPPVKTHAARGPRRWPTPSTSTRTRPWRRSSGSSSGTFGGKQDLYLAALGRYRDRFSRPAFRALAEDPRGLPAVAAFFAALVDARCTGEYAGWGCLVAHAHAGAEHATPEVRALLDHHHDELRDALHAALRTARDLGRLAPAADPGTTADVLALLAYGVNLRSRAGADAATLRTTTDATLAAITA